MNRLRQLQIAKGIDSQRELANIITKQYGTPLTYVTISRIEAGYNENPKFRTLYALAQFFDVSIEYLMGYSDDRHGDGRSKPEASPQEKKDELPVEAQIAIDTFYNKMKSLYAEKK